MFDNFDIVLVVTLSLLLIVSVLFVVVFPENEIELEFVDSNIQETSKPLEYDFQEHNHELEPTKQDVEIKEDNACEKEPDEELKSFFVRHEAPKSPEFIYIGDFIITAYCPCYICCGEYSLNRPLDENGNEIVYTGTGKIARPNHTIAADLSILPSGTEVVIDGITYTVEDTGSAVTGYHIDIYFSKHSDAVNFGCKTLPVYLLKR